MKLSRLVALDILAGLRSLDGIRTGNDFTPFRFSAATTDTIVENILALKSVAKDLEEYREARGKLLECGVRMDENHPSFHVLVCEVNDYLKGEVEVALTLIPKNDLRLESNAIPISVRERIEPVIDRKVT